jgi:hypothetical protein
MKGDRKNLTQAGECGAYEPARSETARVQNAFYAGMWRIFAGAVFGRYHRVARQAAELFGNGTPL